MSGLAKLVIHAPQFLITWSIFFGFGIAVYLAYVISNKPQFSFRELYKRCIPFNIFTDHSFHADVKIYLIGKLTDSIVVFPAVLLNAWICIKLTSVMKHMFPNYVASEFTVFAASICTIVIFIVVEFADFISHYAEHKVPPLWELHKLHHSAQFLNPLTSKRGHPFSMLFGNIARAALTAIPGGLFIFLYNITVVEAVALSTMASKIFVIATLDPLKHSHHPISFGLFDKFLISPHMHQIHHSKTQAHWDKNFGVNLSIFDWMLGTAYKPARGEKADYGISGLSEATLDKYNTMYGAYIQPLIKAYKKLKRMFVNIKPVSQLPKLSS